MTLRHASAPDRRPRAGKSRVFAREDRAVAGAIGIVLMLAVAVTAYAHTVRTKVPVYGEEGEHAWDESVARAFKDMSRSIVEGIEQGSPTTSTIPRPPPAQSIDIPFLGSAAPLPASGSLRFVSECGRMGANHTLGDGRVVADLDGGPSGCLVFQSGPVYSVPFGYKYEAGGVLRLQSGRAIVVSGPPLELDPTSPAEYRVTFALPGLRGSSTTASTDTADVHVDVVPGPASTEIEQAPNAKRVAWTLETAHPAAWKSWFEMSFSQAGFTAWRAAPLPGESVADYVVTCNPVDCSTPGGTGTVQVTIEGPRTDREDVKLSFTYGLVDVNIR